MRYSPPPGAELLAEVAVYQGATGMLMGDLELRGHSVLTGPFRTWSALFHALGDAAAELDQRVRLGSEDVP